jgi:uncharacterized protein DUF6228
MRAVLSSVPGSEHAGRLEFENPRRESGFLVVTAIVAVDDEEWSADIDMIDPYVNDMLGFFQDMARHRRGWHGVMSGTSEYNAMQIAARNPGRGRVDLDVTIHATPQDDHSASLVVPSNALPPIARAMEAILGRATGSRFHTPGPPATWKPFTAWMMSTHAIKTELAALLPEVAPDKAWHKRSTISEMSDWAIHHLDAGSTDANTQRALELAYVMYDSPRGT